MKSILLLPLLTLLALTQACGVVDTPVSAATNPGDHDSIQLDPRSPKLPFLKVETVTESAAGASVSLTGRVGFDEDHTQRVASPIDGRATSILVKPGDHAKIGQALIELTSPHVGELQAAAQKADQDLALAQKALDRAHKMQLDNAVSEKEIAQVETDFKKAKSDAASTAAELHALGITPSDPTIGAALRAQVAGTVVERNVLVGQEVRADGASPLITISNLDTVWVVGDLYEQDLPLVSEGTPVDVTVPAYPEETFHGTVAHIGDVLDPVSHTVKLRCVVPNPNHRLKPEMFAKISVSAPANAKVISIPTKAVLADSEHTRVAVNLGGGRFQLRQVDVGPEVDGRVRVLGGLVPGDRVVTEGALFLKGEIQDQ
jgi:cobalt-zinc-cadmium efflux system membrane fusion protein